MKKNIILTAIGAVILSLGVFEKTWWTGLVGLAPLFYVLVSDSPCPIKRNLICTGIFGVIFYGFCLCWLWKFGWYAYLALVIYETLFLLLFGFLFSFFAVKKGSSPLGQTGRFVFTVFGSALLWTLIDYARSLGIFGFSWYGIYHFLSYDRPLIQIVSYTGSYFLDFLTVSFDMCLVCLFIRKYPKGFFRIGTFEEFYAFMGIMIFIIIHIVGLSFMNAPLPAGYRAAVLQGSTDMFDSSDFQTFSRYRKLFEEQKEKTDLTIMPETTLFYMEKGDYFAQRLGKMTREKETPLLIGANIPANEKQCYNSAVLFSKHGVWQSVQNKIHLVPYGEYVPKILPFRIEGMREYNAVPGKKTKIFTLSDTDIKLCCGICFDACFPKYFREASKKANVFAIISNDWWFGKGFAPQNHLMMNVLRATENRRYILRCGSNGISGTISPYGEILNRTELDAVTSIVCDFGLCDTVTPYAKYGKYYPFVYLVLLIFMVPLLWFAKIK